MPIQSSEELSAGSVSAKVIVGAAGAVPAPPKERVTLASALTSAAETTAAAARTARAWMECILQVGATRCDL